MKTSPLVRQSVVAFGPPSSGVSTVLDALAASTEVPSEVVPYAGRMSIPEVEAASLRSELALVDVEGGLFGVQDVQDLVDNRVIYEGSGAIVRLYAPHESILERCSERPDYVNTDDLVAWENALPPIETRIRAHGLTYFMVPNSDLVEAVTQLARRLSLTR